MTRRAILPVLVLLLAGCRSGPGGGAPGLGSGPRVHSSLEDALPARGSPVLLVFFSTGCPPCYDELFQARLAVEKAGWPLTVIGVCQGPAEDLVVFLEKFAWKLPVVLDRRRRLFRRFGVQTVPHKAVLARGRTVYLDDPYAGPSRRWEDLSACLRKLFPG